MSRSYRWLLSAIVLLPLSTLFAQVTDFKYDSGHTYREVILNPPPPTDGCPSPMCTYHPMIKWGIDTPIKEYTYRGRDAQGNVLHRRGISPVPHLYVIGRSWQWTRGSALLTGVGAGMMLMHRRVETGNVAEHDNEAEQNGEAESTQPNRTI